MPKPETQSVAWVNALKELRSEEAQRLNRIDFRSTVWFVLSVSSSRMLSISLELQAMGFEAAYPVTRRPGKAPHRKAKTRERSIEIVDTLPGFIFFGTNRPVNWLEIKALKGVYGFLGTQGQPVRANAKQIRDMLYADCLDTSYDAVLREAVLATRTYELGDRVTIKSGVFRGLSGEVLKIDAFGNAELDICGKAFDSIFIRPGMAA